ncbi:MAG: pyridoxal 5'-phosphate synthase glutaminase subunit PdxT, partial [Caldiserica bacterium]
MKVGVLAIQGAVSEHINMLKRAGAETLAVKTVEEINSVDGLI